MGGGYAQPSLGCRPPPPHWMQIPSPIYADPLPLNADTLPGCRPSMWTDKHLWKHNLRKLRLQVIKIMQLSSMKKMPVSPVLNLGHCFVSWWIQRFFHIFTFNVIGFRDIHFAEKRPFFPKFRLKFLNYLLSLLFLDVTHEQLKSKLTYTALSFNTRHFNIYTYIFSHVTFVHEVVKFLP